MLPGQNAALAWVSGYPEYPVFEPGYWSPEEILVNSSHRFLRRALGSCSATHMPPFQMRSGLDHDLCTSIVNEALLLIPILKPEQLKHQYLHSPVFCLYLGGLSVWVTLSLPTFVHAMCLNVSSPQTLSRDHVRFVSSHKHQFPPPCPHRLLNPPIFPLSFLAIQASRHVILSALLLA